MGPLISVAAMVLVAAYCLAFGSAMVAGLELHMHWAAAMLLIAVVILLRLWPLLPIAAWYGARFAWGWEWFGALPFVLPVLAYIVPHYWIRISDYWHRPAKRQGA